MLRQLFATVGFNGPVNAQCNFRTLGSALLALLRFATGEVKGWVATLRFVARENKQGEPVVASISREAPSASSPLGGSGKA